jgi:hypothetical protein
MWKQNKMHHIQMHPPSTWLAPMLFHRSCRSCLVAIVREGAGCTLPPNLRFRPGVARSATRDNSPTRITTSQIN